MAMPRSFKVAVTQMDPAPQPVEERLTRADALLAAAAAQGAALVALPELFNTGYIYDERNYALAEPENGPTADWLRQMARRYNLHLGGALLLRDGDEIYDSLLLAAPDGRTWRYDKRYPWAWERAYFRPGRGVTVAETSLGRIGLLICWDVAHLELWQAYAGKVDLMLVSSCPPDVSQPVYTFPDGRQASLEQGGKRVAAMKGVGGLAFGQMVDEQAAWLGVPLLNAMGAGHFSSPLPRPAALILSLLPQNLRLARYLFRGLQVRIDCPMIPGGKVLDAQGRPLAQLRPEAGDALIVADVTLGDAPLQLARPQPPSPLPPIAYEMSDRLLPRLMLPLYRKAMKRIG